MKKIVVLSPFHPQHFEAMAAAAGTDYEVIAVPAGADEETIIQALKGAEIVVGEPSQAAIAASGSVKWVQMTWAGTDKYTRSPIPFPEGVTLTNATGVFGDIISQYLVGTTLSLMQSFPMYIARQRAHHWGDQNRVRTLENATVLIFGAGDIGSNTARRLKPFGTHIVGVCRNTAQPREGFDELCTLEEAESWLPKADVVICCIPNSEATHHYLNAYRLGLMKPTAVLSNAGRGNFIDCMALDHVLREGKLWGAALDVTDPEPLPTGHPLWNAPNCIITPHVAGVTFGHLIETEDKMCAIVCENLERWRKGEALRNLIRTK